MPRHIRKGDNVIVRTGKDKGRTGEVLRVLTDKQDPGAERVVVKGVNVRVKHIKPSQANPQGGTVSLEMPIHISNVSPVDNAGKATRVRYETKDDGSKIRVAATTGEQIGPELKKAK
ncbi:50S ribosomal protein L24 [Algisphaera agarilytica]|uniref:Large ribosomal subunit protein uL24 n=1 Tax=Algisphaera agarilytica TaxID=1385975 RepID=A0A7X0H844_9BACT|nr:50S ribosomal protein L24 [Algisphaera agarilytica]MBB6431037.1 large subunit ribosomal protein L24 [Algisphaera agarilytica]